MFKTICFDRSGSRLWACGMKHWFMWEVNPYKPDWLQHPQTGPLTMVNQSQYLYGLNTDFSSFLDWKIPDISMFVFNHRKAFCLYDKRMRSMRLFDADQNLCTQVALELLCAVIGSHDNQIFYLRLNEPPGGGFLSKSRRTLGLYRRPIQGMKIASEHLVTELPSLEPKATFDIACRDEDSAQVLIVASTQGRYQSIRLDLEEGNQIT